MKHTARKIVLLCCILALCLTGCAAGKSTVVYVPFDEWEGKEAVLEMMPDRSSQRGVLEFDFQEDVQGIAFYCDVWQDGQCIASTPQLRASSTAQIEALVVSQEMEDSLCRWEFVEKNSDGYCTLATVLEQEVPTKKGGCGYSYSWLGSSGKAADLQAGKSYILAQQYFDLTPIVENGAFSTMTPSIDDAQSDSNKQLEECDYAIVLRMDTFATAEEAEAAANEL